MTASLEQRALTQSASAAVLAGSDALLLIEPLAALIEAQAVDRAVVVLSRPVANRPIQQRQKLPAIHSQTRNHCTPPQLTA